jgi:hypothetical protein
MTPALPFALGGVWKFARTLRAHALLFWGVSERTMEMLK